VSRNYLNVVSEIKNIRNHNIRYGYSEVRTPKICDMKKAMDQNGVKKVNAVLAVVMQWMTDIPRYT